LREARVYIALLHHPMHNKRKDIITTSVTNLDLHDISRVARTYNVDGFFVVHPSPRQQELIQKIVGFWQEGYGGEYNPDRKEAFSVFRTVTSLKECMECIREETGREVLTVATDAGCFPNSIAYHSLRKIISNEKRAFLVLFGTGFGMPAEMVKECDYILKPIVGGGEYNHLSVRSAVSIIIDRLLGESWYTE
jgi:hypothetical protein